jgi:DALR anticodon binding domain
VVQACCTTALVSTIKPKHISVRVPTRCLIHSYAVRAHSHVITPLYCYTVNTHTITVASHSTAAAAIGYGAVKYFDLRQHPASAYMFSYDRMLDTRGNTAVYLQFAHARLCSILRKAQAEEGVDLEALKVSDTPVTLQHDSERALAFELMQVSSSDTGSIDCMYMLCQHSVIC